MQRALVLVVGLFAAAGCVGELREKNAAIGTVDAGGEACDPPVAAAPDGRHNEGQPCQACHGASGGAPRFTLGGTLYTDLTGSAPVAGATIHAVDADGVDITMVSATNGNFWTTQPLAFPITVSASSCPTTIPMISTVSEAGADCNAGGCHGSTFRVYLQ